MKDWCAAFDVFPPTRENRYICTFVSYVIVLNVEIGIESSFSVQNPLTMPFVEPWMAC